jgi:hypothetical protein
MRLLCAQSYNETSHMLDVYETITLKQSAVDLFVGSRTNPNKNEGFLDSCRPAGECHPLFITSSEWFASDHSLLRSQCVLVYEHKLYMWGIVQSKTLVAAVATLRSASTQCSSSSHKHFDS